MRELNIEAATDKFDEVLEFIDACLDEAGCPMKTRMQIDVAVEEIFVNIASYAYAPQKGDARIVVESQKDPASVEITFFDSGRQYDPLAREDPDVTLPAEKRNIGGLGIFMTKKLMDNVTYEYANGCNVLKLMKRL